MANPGPAVAGIPNTELALSSGPLQRVIYPTRFTQGGGVANNSLSFQYFPVNYPITATRLDLLANIAAASTTTTNTAAVAVYAIGGIYSSYLSTGTGANTTAYSLLSSGATQSTYSYASNNSGQTQLLNAAIRPISVPININMSPGEYLVAFGVSTSQSSQGAATTALGFSMSVMADLDMLTATNYAEIGVATNSTSNLYPLGVYASTTTALPVTFPNSSILATGANQLPGNFAFVMRNY